MNKKRLNPIIKINLLIFLAFITFFSTLTAKVKTLPIDNLILLNKTNFPIKVKLYNVGCTKDKITLEIPAKSDIQYILIGQCHCFFMSPVIEIKLLLAENVFTPDSLQQIHKKINVLKPAVFNLQKLDDVEMQNNTTLSIFSNKYKAHAKKERCLNFLIGRMITFEMK